MPRIIFLSFSILVQLSTLFAYVSCMCYISNGSAVFNWDANSVYQPCSNDSSNVLSTICCATNRNNPSGGNIANGFTADICLPSGLCQNILTDSGGNKIYAYWRDYCTESDYKSSKCLDACTGDGQHSADGTAPLTPCGDTITATKWCCGVNNTACCSSNNPSDFEQVPISLGQPASSSTPTTASSASVTGSHTSDNPSSISPSVTQPATSTPSSSSSTSSSSGLSTGAKAGVGVGAAIGGLVLLAVGVFLGLYARRRKRSHAAKAYELPQTGYADVPEGHRGLPAHAAHHAGGYYDQPPAPSEVGGGEINEMGTEVIKKTVYRRGGVEEPVEMP
ncbi:uncharacterized protein BDR25DRAFT_367896 [Lindgomyces ingoldianus]|uniref:Uncharacterized protein n=1 Tax=Lindgomyces ingoldianus TaxID=673940 RepID=A0ACB6QW55_9PLEO|nr:uncharacterized protein BDR25DRAFT_367896 [Lindgomyces ingoldianus]KAF2471166.1 hypothetical protein BDR25DRAFT_367896 [Lindgomyces ingoldianus]